MRTVRRSPIICAASWFPTWRSARVTATPAAAPATTPPGPPISPTTPPTLAPAKSLPADTTSSSARDGVSPLDSSAFTPGA